MFSSPRPPAPVARPEPAYTPTQASPTVQAVGTAAVGPSYTKRPAYSSLIGAAQSSFSVPTESRLQGRRGGRRSLIGGA